MHNIIKKEQKNKKIKIEKIDILIFATIIIIFGIALLSFYPAILTSDSVDQMKQTMTNEYNGSHPIFHTFMLGNIARVFGSVSASAMFQIIVFAIVWTWGCKQLRKENNTFKNKIFQYMFTFIISIIPLNFMYSITLWKDILYSYSFLAVLICIYNFIRKDFEFSAKDIVLLIISLICVIRFRYNGPIVGFSVFVILLFLNFRKQKNKKIFLILIASFSILYLITGIPGKVLPQKQINNETVENTGKSIYKTFNGTILHAMGAILNSNIEIENEDLEFLNNILDINIWKESYSPYTAAKIHYNKELNGKSFDSKDDNDRFGNIFIKYAKREPKIVLTHFIKLNTIDWSIKEYAWLNSIVLDNSWVSEISDGKYDIKPKLKKMHDFIYKYSEFTIYNNKFHLLYRPAVPMIISIILILVVSLRKKKIRYLLILLPMFFNIAPYLIIITSQDQRYFYPNYMTCYFCILLYITVTSKICIKKNKTERKDIKKIAVILPINGKKIEKIKENISKINKKYDVIIIGNNFKEDIKKIKCKNIILLELPCKLKKNEIMQCAYKYAIDNEYDAVLEGEDIEKYNEMIKTIEEENADIVYNTLSNTNISSKIKKFYNYYIIRYYTNEKYINVQFESRAITKNIIKEFADNLYTEMEQKIKTILEGKKIVVIK